MLTTEQATKLVDDFIVVVAHGVASPTSDAQARMEQARDHLVAALTGSSRIDRKAIDPNTDTQLVEAITPDAIKEKELIEGKLLLLDDLTVRHRRLHEVLVHYVGCTPDRLHIRSRDLLFMVVDIGLLMRVASGPWRDVVDQIEVDERERQAQIKFAARSTENMAPEIMKKQKAALAPAEAPQEGAPS